jgi:hypothetical protein
MVTGLFRQCLRIIWQPVMLAGGTCGEAKDWHEFRLFSMEGSIWNNLIRVTRVIIAASVGMQNLWAIGTPLGYKVPRFGIRKPANTLSRGTTWYFDHAIR